MIPKFKVDNGQWSSYYLSSLGVDVGHSVLPPVLIVGRLLLTLQGLSVVVLINTILEQREKNTVRQQTDCNEQ